MVEVNQCGAVHDPAQVTISAGDIHVIGRVGFDDET